MPKAMIGYEILVSTDDNHDVDDDLRHIANGVKEYIEEQLNVEVIDKECANAITLSFAMRQGDP